MQKPEKNANKSAPMCAASAPRTTQRATAPQAAQAVVCGVAGSSSGPYL